MTPTENARLTPEQALTALAGLQQRLFGEGLHDLSLVALEVHSALFRVHADNARLREVLDHLAVECESGVIETEADIDKGGLLSRADHDKRIARYIRAALAEEK